MVTSFWLLAWHGPVGSMAILEKIKTLRLWQSWKWNENIIRFASVILCSIHRMLIGHRPISHAKGIFSYIWPDVMSCYNDCTEGSETDISCGENIILLYSRPNVLSPPGEACSLVSVLYPSSHAPESHCNFPPSRVSLASQVCTWICSTEMSKLVPQMAL